MLSQLLNTIREYSTNIKKINTEYHGKYIEYYYKHNLRGILYSPYDKLYNYRTRNVEYSNVYNKNTSRIAALPKNYI